MNNTDKHNKQSYTINIFSANRINGSSISEAEYFFNFSVIPDVEYLAYITFQPDKVNFSTSSVSIPLIYSDIFNALTEIYTSINPTYLKNTNQFLGVSQPLSAMGTVSYIG
ncbi:MAG TPA: hypothetical protein V6C58_00580, partial [Allocoleopsis sp.]